MGHLFIQDAASDRVAERLSIAMDEVEVFSQQLVSESAAGMGDEEKIAAFRSSLVTTIDRMQRLLLSLPGNATPTSATSIGISNADEFEERLLAKMEGRFEELLARKLSQLLRT